MVEHRSWVFAEANIPAKWDFIAIAISSTGGGFHPSKTDLTACFPRGNTHRGWVFAEANIPALAAYERARRALRAECEPARA